MSRRSVRPILAVAFAFAVAVACSPETTAPVRDVNAPTRVDLAVTEITLAPGDSFQVVALARGTGGRPLTDYPISYETADASVVSVRPLGWVHAVALGTTTVRARAGASSAALTVRVLAPVTAQVLLSQVNLALAVGEASLVYVSTFDEQGRPIYGRPRVFETLDPAIATVDNAGRVVAVAAGTTTLRVTVDGIVASTSITVRDDAPLPDATGSWLLDRVGDGPVPMVYWEGKETIDGKLVDVRIQLDSARKTVSADGRYSRRYFFSERHDGVLLFRYGWGDLGRWTLRRVPGTGTVAVQMVSEWIQNLTSSGEFVDGQFRLQEQLYAGEATFATRWRRR